MTGGERSMMMTGRCPDGQHVTHCSTASRHVTFRAPGSGHPWPDCHGPARCMGRARDVHRQARCTSGQEKGVSCTDVTRNSTQNTQQYTVHSTRDSTQYTVHSTRDSIQCTVHSTQYTRKYTVHSTQYTVHRTRDSTQYTVGDSREWSQ